MDHRLYRETIVEMESKNVDPDYIQGWAGGFMGNPKREEQRVTKAYEKGYEDGRDGDTASYADWIAS